MLTKFRARVIVAPHTVTKLTVSKELKTVQHGNNKHVNLVVQFVEIKII